MEPEELDHLLDQLYEELSGRPVSLEEFTRRLAILEEKSSKDQLNLDLGLE